MKEYDIFNSIVKESLEESLNTDKELHKCENELKKNQFMSNVLLTEVGIHDPNIDRSNIKKIPNIGWDSVSKKWFKDNKDTKNIVMVTPTPTHKTPLVPINLKSYPCEFNEKFENDLFQLKELLEVIPGDSIELVLIHKDEFSNIHNIVMQPSYRDIDDFLKTYKLYLQNGNTSNLKKYINTPNCINKSYIDINGKKCDIFSTISTVLNIDNDKETNYEGNIKSIFFTVENDSIKFDYAQNIINLLNNILDPLYLMWKKMYPRFPFTIINQNCEKYKNHREGYAINISVDYNNEEYKRKMNKKLYDLIVNKFKFQKIINFNSYDYIHISYNPSNNICKQLKVIKK